MSSVTTIDTDTLRDILSHATRTAPLATIHAAMAALGIRPTLDEYDRQLADIERARPALGSELRRLVDEHPGSADLYRAIDRLWWLVYEP